MTQKQAKSQAWIWLAPIGLLVAFSLSGFTGSRWSVDAGWYAGIALQVYREGDWWTLGAGDVHYFNKPPMGFWFHGFFLWFFGGELWVIRSSMVLVAAACVAATSLIGRKLATPWTGFWSGVVLATTIEFVRNTDRFRLDYLHTLFVLLAILAAVDAITSNKPRRLLWMGPAIGLALMTKPIAALFVFPLVAIWFVWIGRRQFTIWLIPAIAIALAVAAPWHVAMVIEHGSQFTETYFKSQSLERAIGADFSPEPWWWYLRHLGQTYWPWLAIVGLTLAALRQRKIPRESIPMLKLGIVFGGIGLLGLSLFGDKREHYAFPIYPALAWFSGAWLAPSLPIQLQETIQRRWISLVTTIFLVCAAVALFIAPRFAPKPLLPWHHLYEFIDVQQRAGEAEFWNGRLNYQDAGMIYAKTGVWPKWTHMPDGSTRLPPPGALVIYGDAGETRPPNTAIKAGWWWERIVVIEWPDTLPEGWSIGDPAGDRPVRDPSYSDDSLP